VILGLALRIWLTAAMPYGFFHTDSADLLETADKLVHEGGFRLHPKKTFLVPIVYTVAFAIPGVPVLITIPLAQHALGLLMIVLCGLLCRLWFSHWKWWIIPLTLLVAANPSFLWFEHTPMAESLYVFCTVVLAVTGSVFALHANRASFVALLMALVLQAGARPEGKLFFGFGLILIVLVLWKNKAPWRTLGIHLGITLVVALIVNSKTKTSQAGLLLYTSVVHFTPDDPKCAPGILPFIEPLRTQFQERWKVGMAFPRASQRNKIASAVAKYLIEVKGAEGSKREVNELCKKLAMETLRRSPGELPMHFFYKFRHSSVVLASEDYSDNRIGDKQLNDNYPGSTKLVFRNGKKLSGVDLKSMEDIGAFIEKNYHPERVAWFNTLHDWWEDSLAHFRMTDVRYPNGDKENGMPYYFFVVLAGMALALFRPGKMQPMQISWVLFLLGLAFIIFVTANVKARFRFVFEPFLYIYAFMILDTLVAVLCSGWKKITSARQASV